MPNFNPQLVALGAERINKRILQGLLNDPLKQHIFDHYDPARVVYVNERGQQRAQGLPALLQYLDSHPDEKVFLGGVPKLFDLALEGGGAFGFAHLGTMHAMALRGIWFDRVAGTSAGSIAAALVAGGYKIDLNYKTSVDVAATAPLQPHPGNSLNQILFDDLFRDFTDYEQRIGEVRKIITSNDSLVFKFIKEHIEAVFSRHFSLDAIRGKVQLTSQQVQNAYFNIESTLIDAFLKFKIPVLGEIGNLGIPGVPNANLRSMVAGAAVLETQLATILGDGATKLTADLRNASGAIYTAIENAVQSLAQDIADAFADALVEKLIIKNGNQLDHAWYGLFRLFNFGGFWEGNFVRDWIERHLQQLNAGTGPVLDGSGDKPRILDGAGVPVRAVLFKDLKIDLCIVAADMGPIDPEQPWKPEPMFFSRRTTPDYPVAEAVRRSISLPFVFIPRKLNEGYGGNPSNIPLARRLNINPGNPSLLNGLRSGTTALAGLSAYNNVRHHDHLMFDGGVFFNLPVAVFRDPSDFVFDYKKDSKPVIISNINSTRDSSERPHDVPPGEYPEPIKSLQALLAGLFQSGRGGSSNASPGIGMIKVDRAKTFTMGFLLTEHQESELGALLELVPNSFFVDMPLRDPAAGNSSATEYTSDGRIDSGNFNMGKTAKKWLVKNGFDAAKAALAQYEQEVPALAGKLILPAAVDPYLHLLTIGNPSLSNRGITALAQKCKQGDNPYVDGQLSIAAPGLTTSNAMFVGIETRKDGYTGIGATWIKIANNGANRGSTDAAFLSFDTNLRTRVLFAIDVAPAFASAVNGWELLPQPLVLNNPANPSQPVLLKVFQKLFEKGRVVIPAARSNSAIANNFAYAVLVRPI